MMLKRLYRAIGLYETGLNNAPDQMKVEQAIDRAIDYQIFAPVYLYLKDQSTNLPQTAHIEWRKHIACHALVRSELKRIVQRLGNDFPYLILKGQPLAQLLFANPYARTTTDIDIVVRPQSLPQIRQILESLGYIALENRAQPRHWAYNQFAMYHHSSHLAVDIHWAIAFPRLNHPLLDECFRTHHQVAYDQDRQIPVLDPEMLFIQLCFHYHQHQGALKCLLDLAAWYDRFHTTADFTRIETTARELGIWGVIQWPIHVLFRLTAMKMPIYQARVDAPISLWTTIACKAYKDCLTKQKITASEQAILRVMANLGKTQSILFEALSMLLVDGKKQKCYGFLNPIVLGPHRVGRWVYEASQKIGYDLHLPYDGDHFRDTSWDGN